jgi:hypothetical protein
MQEKRAGLCETQPFVENPRGLNSNQIIVDLQKINTLRSIIELKQKNI